MSIQADRALENNLYTFKIVILSIESCLKYYTKNTSNQ